MPSGSNHRERDDISLGTSYHRRVALLSDQSLLSDEINKGIKE